MTFIHLMGEAFNSINLPYNAPEVILKSGIYGFGIMTLLSSNIDRGLKTGGVSMTASFISALTCPIFEGAFNKSKVNIFHYAGKLICDISFTVVFFEYVFNKKVNPKATVLLATVGLIKKIISGYDFSKLSFKEARTQIMVA